jgi:hypothetical protein
MPRRLAVAYYPFPTVGDASVLNLAGVLFDEILVLPQHRRRHADA